jgi:hypothetical protein
MHTDEPRRAKTELPVHWKITGSGAWIASA